MDSELERDMRAQCYWTKGLVRDAVGFKDYAAYLASIPEPPEPAEHSILVDPRVDFERICRQETCGFSAASLDECRHEDSGQPVDQPYWILVQLMQHPEDTLIRETIRAIPDFRRGCTLMEGLAIRLQEPAKIGDQMLILPGSRYYDPPDDRHFCGVLYSHGQFAPICMDVRLQALVAVSDKRLYT